MIDEKDADRFISHFFPEIDKSDLLEGAKLSPKILLVEPGKKLSWQYHHRRAEIWKLIWGKAAVATSDTDKEKNRVVLQVGDIVRLKQGERHRLIGLEDEWGVVAEIWPLMVTVQNLLPEQLPLLPPVMLLWLVRLTLVPGG